MKPAEGDCIVGSDVLQSLYVSARTFVHQSRQNNTKFKIHPGHKECSCSYLPIKHREHILKPH